MEENVARKEMGGENVVDIMRRVNDAEAENNAEAESGRKNWLH